MKTLKAKEKSQPSLQEVSIVSQTPRLEHNVRENVLQNDAEKVQMWSAAIKPEQASNNEKQTESEIAE
jgi:hypothetical protein